MHFQLTRDEFRDFIIALGFSEDNENLLSKLYIAKQSEISEVLSTIGVKLPIYESMEWRFETQVWYIPTEISNICNVSFDFVVFILIKFFFLFFQIASRASLNQITPLIILDFNLRNNVSDSIEHVTLQTDPNNLLFITEQLEQALQDGRNQHLRKIARTVK